MVDLRRVATVAGIVMTTWGSASVRAQTAGVVVDERQRPLPLVTVVSRTRNGFLALRTDAHGRFAFPGRPHGPGSSVDAQTAGYATGAYRLDEDDPEVTITLFAAPNAPLQGWTIGLGEDLDLSIRDGTDALVDGNDLRAGVSYTIVVATAGTGGCARGGPVLVETDGNRVLIAVADFVRGGVCEARRVEFSRRIGHVFPAAGEGEIRIRGRWRDLVVPVTVRP